MVSLVNRYIPVEDLYQIYKLYYNSEKVPREVIEACTSILLLERYSGLEIQCSFDRVGKAINCSTLTSFNFDCDFDRLGERLAIGKLFPYFADESPFLVDMFNPYFLGGVDDMAAWTRYIWKDIIYMLEHGVQWVKLAVTSGYLLNSYTSKGGKKREYKWILLKYNNVPKLIEILYYRSCELPHNILFTHCNSSGRNKLNRNSTGKETNGYFRELRPQRYKETDIHKKYTKRGVYLKPSPQLKVIY